MTDHTLQIIPVALGLVRAVCTCGEWRSDLLDAPIEGAAPTLKEDWKVPEEVERAWMEHCLEHAILQEEVDAPPPFDAAHCWRLLYEAVNRQRDDLAEHFKQACDLAEYWKAKATKGGKMEPEDDGVEQMPTLESVE